MVKGTSCLGSNEAFRVQVLVGVLEAISERKGNPIGDGTGLEAGRARLIAALRVQLRAPPRKAVVAFRRSVNSDALMVKGRSCLGPNEVFRVRILVGALVEGSLRNNQSCGMQRL
jgi:hypothetical protein